MFTRLNPTLPAPSPLPSRTFLSRPWKGALRSHVNRKHKSAPHPHSLLSYPRCAFRCSRALTVRRRLVGACCLATRLRFSLNSPRTPLPRGAAVLRVPSGLGSTLALSLLCVLSLASGSPSPGFSSRPSPGAPSRFPLQVPDLRTQEAWGSGLGPLLFLPAPNTTLYLCIQWSVAQLESSAVHSVSSRMSQMCVSGSRRASHEHGSHPDLGHDGH